MNWLILRGLVREQKHWREFKPLFAERTKSNVYSIDVPGMGTEAHRPSPKTVHGIMLDVRNRLEELKKQSSDKEWGICCVSLGSMVALQWISVYPEDFKRAVITNTSAKPLSSTFKRFKPKNILNLPEFISTSDKVKRERLILSMTSSMHTKEELDQIANEYARFAPDLKQFRKVGLAHLIAGSIFKIPKNLKNANGNPVKILVVNSTQDTLVDTSCSQEIAKYLGAPIRFHDKANHDLPLDDPKWYVETIVNWIGST